jgi:type I restriction enzyme S subunit
VTLPTLRRVTRLQRGAGFPHDRQGDASGELPFFKVGDFASRLNERFLNHCNNWVSLGTARELRAVSVPPGTVLLPKIGAALLANARRVTTEPSVFDNNVLGVVPESIDSTYLYYLLSTIDLGEFCNPGPVPSLDDSALLDVRVPFSDAGAQRAIADYLDTETARIDALIEKKRRMVALLDLRRMSVVTDGVSGRLTAESTEPSTLHWIGERGAAWKEARLSLVAKLGTGHTPSRSHPEWWLNCDIPWITTGEVTQVRTDRVEILHETRERISSLGVANSSAEIHPAGTVVLCRTASAGYSAIMGSDMATSQDFATWTCGPQLRPRFLLLCLRAMRQDLLGRLAMGSTHKTIYMPDIESLRIPLPSIAAQDRIIEAVSVALAHSDAITDVVRRQIELLAERRQALITAAVTGELNIPGVAA